MMYLYYPRIFHPIYVVYLSIDNKWDMTMDRERTFKMKSFRDKRWESIFDSGISKRNVLSLFMTKYGMRRYHVTMRISTWC